MFSARMRNGLSSVLTSIIMVAVVLSIGISVWGVTHSAATVMRSDYYDDVMESVYKIKERFRIENVGVNMTAAPSIQVWVLNYGETEVNITRIKVSGGGNESYYYPPYNNASSNGVVLSPGEFKRFDIEEDTIAEDAVEFRKGITISVRVESEGENKAYEITKLP
jgi:flagellin-like protein